jgi:hypothetical protein
MNSLEELESFAAVLGDVLAEFPSTQAEAFG